MSEETPLHITGKGQLDPKIHVMRHEIRSFWDGPLDLLPVPQDRKYTYNQVSPPDLPSFRFPMPPRCPTETYSRSYPSPPRSGTRSTAAHSTGPMSKPSPPSSMSEQHSSTIVTTRMPNAVPYAPSRGPDGEPYARRLSSSSTAKSHPKHWRCSTQSRS